MNAGFRATRFFPTAQGRIADRRHFERLFRSHDSLSRANRAQRQRGSAAKGQWETNLGKWYGQKIIGALLRLIFQFERAARTPKSSPVAPRPESRCGATRLLIYACCRFPKPRLDCRVLFVSPAWRSASGWRSPPRPRVSRPKRNFASRPPTLTASA